MLDSDDVHLCSLIKRDESLNPGDKNHCCSNVSRDVSEGDTNIELPPCHCKVRSKYDCVLESKNKLSKDFVALQKEVTSTTKNK